jgi:hypothetical protein
VPGSGGQAGDAGRALANLALAIRLDGDRHGVLVEHAGHLVSSRSMLQPYSVNMPGIVMNSADAWQGSGHSSPSTLSGSGARRPRRMTLRKERLRGERPPGASICHTDVLERTGTAHLSL